MKNEGKERKEVKEGKPRNRDFQYVYFIENHIINSNVTISLENNSNEVNSLEEISLPNYKSDKGVEFKCTLFRFKLEIKQKKKVEVTVNLKDDKDEIFSKTITILDPTKIILFMILFLNLRRH